MVFERLTERCALIDKVVRGSREEAGGVVMQRRWPAGDWSPVYTRAPTILRNWFFVLSAERPGRDLCEGWVVNAWQMAAESLFYLTVRQLVQWICEMRGILLKR